MIRVYDSGVVLREDIIDMKYTITYKQIIELGKRTRQITKKITVYRNKKPTTEQILDLVKEDSGGNFDRESIRMTY